MSIYQNSSSGVVSVVANLLPKELTLLTLELTLLARQRSLLAEQLTLRLR